MWGEEADGKRGAPGQGKGKDWEEVTERGAKREGGRARGRIRVSVCVGVSRACDSGRRDVTQETTRYSRKR